MKRCLPELLSRREQSAISNPRTYLNAHIFPTLSSTSHTSSLSRPLYHIATKDRLIAAAGEAGSVLLSDGRATQTTILAHDNAIFDLDLSSTTVFSASGDGTVKSFDISRQSHLSTYTGHSGSVKCVQQHGHLLLSGGRDGSIRVYDIRTPGNRSIVSIPNAHTPRSSITSLLFDGSCIVSGGSSDSRVLWWDTRRLQSLASLHVRKKVTPVSSFLCSPTCHGITSLRKDERRTRLLVNVLHEGSFVVHYDSASPSQSHVYGVCSTHKTSSFYIQSDFIADGDAVVAGSSDGLVYLYDSRSRRASFVIKCHSGEVNGVCRSPSLFASCSDDGSVRVHSPCASTRTGKTVQAELESGRWHLDTCADDLEEGVHRVLPESPSPDTPSHGRTIWSQQSKKRKRTTLFDYFSVQKQHPFSPISSK